jgi:hypothetical protein
MLLDGGRSRGKLAKIVGRNFGEKAKAILRAGRRKIKQAYWKDSAIDNLHIPKCRHE